jgi:hypothetical protein
MQRRLFGGKIGPDDPLASGEDLAFGDPFAGLDVRVHQGNELGRR